MSIEYKIQFKIDNTKLIPELKGLPNFVKQNENIFYYQTSNRTNFEVVIEITNYGILLIDYLSGLGREIIGILVEKLTGLSDKIIIEEK